MFMKNKKKTVLVDVRTRYWNKEYSTPETFNNPVTAFKNAVDSNEGCGGIYSVTRWIQRRGQEETVYIAEAKENFLRIFSPDHE